MKKNYMSRIIAPLLTVIAVFIFASVYAEGLLPSLSETVGIAMPSLGEALSRYPDNEIENDGGSVTEVYINVTEIDFNIFSVYLEEQGAELDDYHVESGVLTAEIRAKDSSFSLSYDSKNREAKVTYPAGTFDEWIKSAKTYFSAGRRLLEEGKTYEALNEFLMIPQYKQYTPFMELLQNDKNLAIAVYKTPGAVVELGHYEQDSIVTNGQEPIEWIVLDYSESEHKALLLSKYGLDAMPYNTAKEDITWEKCTLRNWLKSEFLQTAFSEEEQSAILTTAVDNSASQGYSEWDSDGGNNTQDQVFLLSYAEANRYLDVTYDDGNNIRARVALTPDAIVRGAYVSDNKQTSDGEEAGWWWLRSPGRGQDGAAHIHDDGSLRGYSVSDSRGVVRPALWLDLESGFFK